MAKVRLNTALGQLRGELDGIVFRTVRDEVFAMKKPVFGAVPWSEAQRQGRSRFSAAKDYAKAVWQDPEARAFYVALGRKKRVWRSHCLAIGDYLNSPEVTEVNLRDCAGVAGDAILVKARDDVEVTAVHVEFRNAAGEVIQAGAAGRSLHGWEYRLTETLPAGESLTIGVSAWDRPRNEARKVVPFVRAARPTGAT